MQLLNSWGLVNMARVNLRFESVLLTRKFVASLFKDSSKKKTFKTFHHTFKRSSPLCLRSRFREREGGSIKTG